MLPIRLFLLAVVLVVAVYLSSSIVARRFKKIHLSRALLYISSVAMIGVFTEIFVDTIYVHLFHEPLWHYNFLPIHHAYTSQYSPVLWGVFGFYLYLFHHNYEKWSRRELVSLALIFSLEAPVVEGLADLISKPILGQYIYYYHPGNFWHITSLQGVPFYFLLGFLIAETIHWFKASPHFYTFMSSWVTTVTIFFK